MNNEKNNQNKTISSDMYTQRMPAQRSKRSSEREIVHAAAREEKTREEAGGKKRMTAAETERARRARAQREAAKAQYIKEKKEKEERASQEQKIQEKEAEVKETAVEAEPEAQAKADSPAPEPAAAVDTAAQTEAPPKQKTKKKTQKKQSPAHMKKSVLALAIIAFVLAVSVAAVFFLLKSKQSPYKDTGNYMDQIRNQEIKINDVAAIDDFFASYYLSLSSGNTTDLERMFDHPSKAPITTETSTIVNKYDGFRVYVTGGILENEIVAFVYNDISFSNIAVTAPSVDSFYLTYDAEEAALKIKADMYTDQNILKFMNLVSYREPIRSLLSDTNEQLSEALAANSDLNNLYVLMQSMKDSVDYGTTFEEGAAQTPAGN